MKFFSNYAFLFMIVSVGLTACGDSRKYKKEQVENCIEVSRPVLNQKEKIKSTVYFYTVDGVLRPESNSINYIEIKIINIDSTSILIKKKFTTDNFIIDEEESYSYTISNGFIDYTKSTMHDVFKIREQDEYVLLDTTDITIDYKPFQRREAAKVCENQTWTSTYTRTTDRTTSKDGNSSSIESISEIYTIEAINESKTVPAGVFNTYILKKEAGNVIEKLWIDINTGKTVYKENRDTTGKLLRLSELIE